MLIIKLWEAPKEMGAEDWKTITEIARNILETLAVAGGVFVVVNWLRQRQDRATGILPKLEENFDPPIIKQGRACLEENDRFEKLGPWLD